MMNEEKLNEILPISKPTLLSLGYKLKAITITPEDEIRAKKYLQFILTMNFKLTYNALAGKTSYVSDYFYYSEELASFIPLMKDYYEESAGINMDYFIIPDTDTEDRIKFIFTWYDVNTIANDIKHLIEESMKSNNSNETQRIDFLVPNDVEYDLIMRKISNLIKSYENIELWNLQLIRYDDNQKKIIIEWREINNE